MRLIAAIAALAFTAAPGMGPHQVTLRLDTVSKGQVTKVVLKTPISGLQSSGSNEAAASQLTITTPASVTVSAGANAITIDAMNDEAVRVSFEQGGSARELSLDITGAHLILRRNMDGDFALGTRVLPAPAH